MQDETTPQDAKAMPPASHGSVAGEPVAWAVLLAYGERIYDVYDFEDEAKAIDEVVTGNHGVVPLYRSPKLTEEEREVILRLRGTLSCYNNSELADMAVVDGLLERLG